MDPQKPDFIILDHTADLGILVRGTDTKDLFTRTAHAMTYIMVKTGPEGKSRSTNVSITGQDLDELMVNWLGEILYLFHGEKEIIKDIMITSISKSHLDATIEVISFAPELHEILYEIKAVTYHQIGVTEMKGYWEAKVIFDL
jgi:SHS2 domain-containing protein